MAIRITKVYTRSGDRGETGLVGGSRAPKDSPRIVAYGTIDELNSVLGLARVEAEDLEGEAKVRLGTLLRRLQNELFDLGSELATPPDAEYEGMWKASGTEVAALEAEIDRCQKDLEPLESFILPGGGRVGALFHLSRTVCRRAEIEILRLSRSEPVNADLLRYVNRLSDLLFVLARWVAKSAGQEEFLWERGLRLPREKSRKTRKT